MTALDPDYSQWLRTGHRTAITTDAALAARWGPTATTTEISSPLALAGGATAEGARQIAFLSGPTVVDELIVPGLRRDLIGQPHTDGDEVVFVIGFDEGADNASETTVLTVLRRMR